MGTQALVYSMDDDVIREMFADLLAADMNADTKKMTHPAFVEIIKEMTPVEAKLLQIVRNRAGTEFGIRIGSHSKFFPVATRYSFSVEGIDTPECARGLSNLERLGLTQIRDEYTLSGNLDDLEKKILAEYEHMKKSFAHPEIKKHLGVGDQEPSVFSIRIGIHITPLGESFVRVCMARPKTD